MPIFAKHFVDLPDKAGKFEEMQKCSLIPSTVSSPNA
jgi:hypothetical protein